MVDQQVQLQKKLNIMKLQKLILGCIETPSDAIDSVWVRRFREWGYTNSAWLPY